MKPATAQRRSIFPTKKNAPSRKIVQENIVILLNDCTAFSSDHKRPLRMSVATPTSFRKSIKFNPHVKVTEFERVSNKDEVWYSNTEMKMFKNESHLQLQQKSCIFSGLSGVLRAWVQSISQPQQSIISSNQKTAMALRDIIPKHLTFPSRMVTQSMDLI
uniref:Uncharacterized protein n=1 Tax=Trieres chinensis TaxID=1514140 RepID=A0A7S2ESU6_TRICV